uniref:C-type lectin domain-containing protein n=1 Tax=Nothobranchius korthausae TaxID=1143690 RepID=A0A1A8GWM0_9TELE
MTWFQAQSYCRQHYTDLASVRNLSENEQIWRLITGSTWIGLYKNTWKWSNGLFFMYNYWQGLEPDGGNEKCTAANFANSGRWVDWPCGLEKPFVCYHDPVPLRRTVIKLKVVKTSALHLEDPAVQEDLLQQLKQKLMDRNMTGDINLSWKRQPSRDVFYRDKTGKN